MKAKQKSPKRSEAQIKAIRRNYAIRANKAKQAKRTNSSNKPKKTNRTTRQEAGKNDKKPSPKPSETTKRKKFGNLPIHKYQKNGNHPHVVVKKENEKWLSVGLTSSDRSGHHKLREVEESSGKKAYMHHSVTHAPKENYNPKKENFTIDTESEKIAKSMVNNYLQKKK